MSDWNRTDSNRDRRRDEDADAEGGMRNESRKLPVGKKTNSVRTQNGRKKKKIWKGKKTRYAGMKTIRNGDVLRVLTEKRPEKRNGGGGGAG